MIAFHVLMASTVSPVQIQPTAHWATIVPKALNILLSTLALLDTSLTTLMAKSLENANHAVSANTVLREATLPLHAQSANSMTSPIWLKSVLIVRLADIVPVLAHPLLLNAYLASIRISVQHFALIVLLVIIVLMKPLPSPKWKHRYVLKEFSVSVRYLA